MDNVSLKPRRRPVQSRARLTQQAILDAFVRLLREKSYARLTMRDIAALAGVGLGTVYEHFPNKRAIAANAIHQRFKAVGTQLLACAAARQEQPSAQLLDAVLDRVIELHVSQTQEWSLLIELERQISGLAAYRSLYAQFIDLWRQILQVAAPFAPDAAAATVHAAVYGLLYQTLLYQPQTVGTPEFRRQLGKLVHGYLAICALP